MSTTAVAPATATRRIALIGNPNTGKTTLFNALTGLSHRVGNYPGVTVEKKTGKLADGVELIDLPGTYSLAPHSPDELVAVELLLGDLKGEARPDLVLIIVDASNLQRNLYLVTQVMELGLPIVVALNMMDVAEKNGVSIDVPKLSESLGLPLVPIVASKSEGLQAVRDAIQVHLGDTPPKPDWIWPKVLTREIEELKEAAGRDDFLLYRALIDEEGAAEIELARMTNKPALKVRLGDARARIKKAGAPAAALEAQMRYGWISRKLSGHVVKKAVSTPATDKMDALLTHRLFGSVFFIAVMTVVFMMIFRFAGPFMDLIDGLFGSLGDSIVAAFAETSMAGGALESLLVDGVVAGVGGVLIFIPQIAMLFLFVALLEDCGYMARAAFLMDRVLRFCGLSGHSFIPMMSSFACAVPGVMAARTIANPRDRLATIMVAPLMSCSARIPVYILMIAAFVPVGTVWGFLDQQGLVFAGMYFVGVVAAIPVAFLLKRTLLKGPTPSFVMELPSYKVPNLKTVFFRVWEAVKAFTIRAGTIIFAITVIIWAMNYYPRPAEIGEKWEAARTETESSLAGEGEALEERLAEIDSLEAGEYQRQSYFARMGHTLEPLFKPLGWDWRIGMAALASFPAREVIVATLGIIYDLGGDLDVEDEADQTRLAEKFKAAKWPDGKPVFNLPVALSIMVFFALCAQCGATVATIKRETNSWKWAGFSFGYMTVLAYFGALITYQVGMLFL